MTDPFAPFPTAPRRPAPFPRERLLRAGLDEDTVARLESEYEDTDAAGRVEFGRYVTANSDDVIRDRFTSDASVADPDAPAPLPTYDDLNDETIDELDDRLRAWNEAHPDQHLTIAGRKGEKIGRLLDAYESEQGDAFPATAPEVSEPPATLVAGQQLPTAPTATTPEGAPQEPVTGPEQPAGTVETGNASTGA